jgi:toxin ParE1/3/4
MSRVVVLPDADQDLYEQALYYLERAAPKTAMRWYDQAAATFEFLAGQPEIRVQTPRLAFWGIRSWIVSGFERHEVFYRMTEEGIAVVRVLHGAQDLENLS